MRHVVNCQTGERSIDYDFVPPADLRTLDQVKADLCAALDSIAAEKMPSNPNRAALHAEKFAEANGVDGLGQEQANALTPEQMIQSFPLLSASVGIEAPDLWGAAQLVIGKYHAWSNTAAMIERARLLGKKSINDSASVTDAQAAMRHITWPT